MGEKQFRFQDLAVKSTARRSRSQIGSGRTAGPSARTYLARRAWQSRPTGDVQFNVEC